MNDFTFGIFTYNQEEFIIEHLESIKRVIQRFGNHYLVDIVISDDASKDNTVLYAKKWIEENSSLFSTVEIITHKENVGIVNNFLDTIRAIKTNRFKILAGDDLYCLNDIFSYADKNKLVISPVYSLQENIIVLNKYNVQQFNLALRHENEIKFYLKRTFRYYFPLISPGILYTRDLVDDGFFDSLEDNHWIEDVPSMYYLVNKNETQILIKQIPYVIYRNDVGISNNSTHSLNKEYNTEALKLRKKIFIENDRYPCNYLNPHYYCRFIERLINNFAGKFINKKIMSCNARLTSSLEEVATYYKDINLSAKSWHKKNDILIEESK